MDYLCYYLHVNQIFEGNNLFVVALNQDFLFHSIEEYHNCTVHNSLGLLWVSRRKLTCTWSHQKRSRNPPNTHHLSSATEFRDSQLSELEKLQFTCKSEMSSFLISCKVNTGPKICRVFMQCSLENLEFRISLCLISDLERQVHCTAYRCITSQFLGLSEPAFVTYIMWLSPTEVSRKLCTAVVSE
jgi:hypothetical protein